jgi:hypothetical protein
VFVEVADLLGYCAAAASLVAFSAKTMIPLRVAAIVSNVLFISYGIAGMHGPPVILHATLLPLNIHRLVAMRRLIQRVGEASRTQTFNATWLQPYMKPKSFRAGDIIFCKGEIADGAFYLTFGRIRFPELDRTAEGGLLFGEIAMFTPGGTRTLSCLCETDVETLFITSDDLRQLYFQNPQFGFQLVRLIVGRLVGQIDTLERERRRRPAAEAATSAPILQGTMTPPILERSFPRPASAGLQGRQP